MDTTCTAFQDGRYLASGPVGDVALAVKAAAARETTSQILTFDDRTGRVIDFDLRGSDDDVVARLISGPAQSRAAPAAKTPGRPKLGVVARSRCAGLLTRPAMPARAQASSGRPSRQPTASWRPCSATSRAMRRSRARSTQETHHDSRNLANPGLRICAIMRGALPLPPLRLKNRQFRPEHHYDRGRYAGE
jgi:hypothetical protein